MNKRKTKNDLLILSNSIWFTQKMQFIDPELEHYYFILINNICIRQITYYGHRYYYDDYVNNLESFRQKSWRFIRKWTHVVNIYVTKSACGNSAIYPCIVSIVCNTLRDYFVKCRRSSKTIDLFKIHILMNNKSL